jgi:hypothetical protein
MTNGLPSSSASSGRTVIGCDVVARVLADASSVAARRREVEAPDVAEHVAAVGAQRRVVDDDVVDVVVDLRQAARRRRSRPRWRRDSVGILWMISPSRR